MKKDYSLEALGLLDSSVDLGLLNIVELAASMLGGSISFTSLIEHHKSRQYLPAFVGLPIELEIARQTSIEESICKFVQQSQKPIVIADLQDDERTKDNPLVHRYDLRSYIGTPIHSIVKRLVEMMNGDISLCSRVGEGTEISITLPLQAETPSASAE